MLKPLKEGIKIRICIRTFGLGIRKNAFDFNIAFYGRSMVNILIWWVDDKFCRDSRLSHVSCLLAFRVSWYYMRHRRCHLSSTSTYLLLNRMDIIILILLKTFHFYLKIWTFAQRSRPNCGSRIPTVLLRIIVFSATFECPAAHGQQTRGRATWAKLEWMEKDNKLRM